MNGYIYLASPYTAKNPDGSFNEELMEFRYREVLNCAAHLIRSGLTVYCPIAISHECDKLLGRKPPEFWYNFDKPFIENMEYLFILKLPGYQESSGIKAEEAKALELNIPIIYLNWIDPET